MNIVNRLTLRHLWKNKGRTLMTIMGIMLSVSMVCAVAGFVASVQDVMLRSVKESRGDYHIVYIDVTEETAQKIADEDVFSTYYTEPSDTGPSDTAKLQNIYLRFENPDRNCEELAGGIAKKYKVDTWGSNSEQLALEGVIVRDNIMLTFIIIAVVIIAIIVIGSVIVIANAFYISASERVRQFGLLKSVGATKSQIARSILFEAFLLAVIAIPLGIALGFLIQGVVLSLTNGLLGELNEMSDQALEFRVVFNPIIIYISVAIAAATLLISAWLPARRAAKASPIDAIRQTKDIKMRGRKLKTSRLTQKLFGFEGTLAAKQLKRSRGKYRATVISLTVSIVLFVSVSSFVGMMNKSANMEYGGFDFDVLISTAGKIDKADAIEKQLLTIPDAKMVKYQSFPEASTTLPKSFLTADSNKYYESLYGQKEQLPQTPVNLISYPDNEWNKLAPAKQGALPGILINTSGKISVDDKHVEYKPYNYKSGTTLALDSVDGAVVTLADEIKEIPSIIPSALYNGQYINILVPESVFTKLAQENAKELDIGTAFSITTADPNAFCEKAFELMPEEKTVSVMNLSQITELNRNIVLIIMLFGYGFIAMLSLIAVTSVVATISTNMALRKQEFAMLHSVGMTPGGMNKMLNLESLMYGIKSLAIGLPIGTALSYLMYFAMSNTIEFAYQLPWSSMAISAACVMILTFGTMRYGKRKLNKISIVDAIRRENV